MLKKPRRPTSLQLEDHPPAQPVLRSTSQRHKQLRLGVSSLVVNKTDAPNISRNASCPSPFSPYSPLTRNSTVYPLRPVLERPQSSQSAQIKPSRLSGRPSRPPSRAQARHVPPPTSPSCDNQGTCCSPTSSLLSGPLSPTSSVLSPFQTISEMEISSSPFQSNSDNNSYTSPFQQNNSSPFPSLTERASMQNYPFSSLPERECMQSSPFQQQIPSDQESISSRSQTDSISLRSISLIYFSLFNSKVGSKKKISTLKRPS